MILPNLKETYKATSTTDVFKGYNHNLRIADGEWFDMENMTSDYYPVLSPRGKRAVETIAKGEVDYICGDDNYMHWIKDATLYYNNGTTVAFRGELTEANHKIVTFGAYLLIFPEKKYVNRETLKSGDIEAIYEASGSMTFSMTNVDGEDYENVAVQDVAPTEPTNGDLWIDTFGDTDVLKRYSASQGKWVDVITTYVRIEAEGIGSKFAVDDCVRIGGIQQEGLAAFNTNAIIKDRGDDYIVVIGILRERMVIEDASTVRVSRRMPQSINYDCMFESNNRLWVCQTIDEKMNSTEIYASKLGDFKNWNSFEGLSTDSYVLSTGQVGDFTGGINFNGNPTFFKNNMMYRIYGSMPSEYQLSTESIVGCGYAKSLKSYNGALIYQASDGYIYMYDGSIPVNISEGLNPNRYKGILMHKNSYGVAEVYNDKYYISLKNGDIANLYVYDIKKQLWHREDNTHVKCFALTRSAEQPKLNYLDATDNRVKSFVVDSYDTAEGQVHWQVESGMLSERTPKKYISKLNVRMSMEVDSLVLFYIEYDSSGTWEHICSVKGSKLSPFVIPIKARRCDHMRLKIQGVGDAKIYSITKTIAEGSDW